MLSLSKLLVLFRYPMYVRQFTFMKTRQWNSYQNYFPSRFKTTNNIHTEHTILYTYAGTVESCYAKKKFPRNIRKKNNIQKRQHLDPIQISVYTHTPAIN